MFMSLYNADVLACNRIASLAARVYRFARRLWSRHRDEEQRAGTMPTTDALATAAEYSLQAPPEVVLIPGVQTLSSPLLVPQAPNPPSLHCGGEIAVKTETVNKRFGSTVTELRCSKCYRAVPIEGCVS